MILRRISGLVGRVWRETACRDAKRRHLALGIRCGAVGCRRMPRIASPQILHMQFNSSKQPTLRCCAVSCGSWREAASSAPSPDNSGAVRSVAVTSDGHYVIFGSGDRTDQRVELSGRLCRTPGGYERGWRLPF